MTKSQIDAATAKELLSTKSRRCQLLVNSGFHNSKLFTNLGNASWNAVFAADNVSLHADNGEEFVLVITLNSAKSHRVETLANRGKWAKVRTTDGRVG